MIFYKIGLNKVALELMFFCLWLTKFCNILFSPIISHIKMDDNLQPTKKLQQFRVQIRDRNRRNRVNVQRSQALKQLTLSQQQITSLKTSITQSTLADHLTSLKFLSLHPEHLNEFLNLASPLMVLARETKQSYQYADAMTVLINMALCKDFKFDEELALGLSGFLLEKEREMEVMELYSNLLNFGGHKMFEGLVKLNFLEFLEKRQKKKFQDDKKMTAFLDLMFASLAYHSHLSQQDLKRLIQIINQSELMIPAMQMEFQVCAKLSRFSQDLTVEHAVALIQGFKPIFKSVLQNKKTKQIVWLTPFLTAIAQNPQGFNIFKSQSLFDSFQKSLQTLNPSTKQTLITILSYMSGTPQSNSSTLFLSILNLVRTFPQLPLQVKLAFAFFVTNTLTKSMDPLLLTVLKDYGLIGHVKWMLESGDVEAINAGLMLLGAVLAVDAGCAKVCEEGNLHVVLFHLQQHPLNEIYQRSYNLIDMYFKVE